MVSTRRSKRNADDKIPPNTYKHIKRNIYKLRLKRKIAKKFSADSCDCTNPLNGCDEHCLNRLCHMECGLRNCPIGVSCGNRRIQQGPFARCTIFSTVKKGYGLKIQQSIASNKFIIELIGEVIEYEKFINDAKEGAAAGVTYAVRLRSDAILCAAKMGNIARFINHSCRPNSRLEKWIIDGEMRVGVFSLEPIAADEEITIDYSWGRVAPSEREICYCESAECRGYIL